MRLINIFIVLLALVAVTGPVSASEVALAPASVEDALTMSFVNQPSLLQLLNALPDGVGVPLAECPPAGTYCAPCPSGGGALCVVQQSTPCLAVCQACGSCVP